MNIEVMPGNANVQQLPDIELSSHVAASEIIFAGMVRAGVFVPTGSPMIYERMTAEETP